MSERADKTQKLYKIDQAAREKAERLYRESGFEFEGDFFAHVISIHELQQMKDGLGAGYQKIISNAEFHAKSLVDAITSIIQAENIDRIALAETHEEKVAGLASELYAQQDEITQLKRLHQDATEQAAQSMDENAELRKYINNIESLNAKNEEILAENRERIERLSKMVTDGQDAINQKQELEFKISEISRISDQQSRELKEAQKAAEEEVRHFHDDLTRMENQCAEKIQNITERAEIAQERAVLAVRRELEDQANNERAELTKQLQTSQRESNAEVRRLYEEVDKLRQQLSTLSEQQHKK
ncbi:hypothetical protein A8L34_27725 [Bacillus sp. FJAT-27264]|uniref:hypothetical protein n=1 Tax=Paenibacillus sp. (strain DSM 101736 / FJAT-27264) TaxID=1850362 RepID=UPI000807E451|nr:hypothetical protein [Bacillus sp. FJAT-27264]OBZ15841.1 hypothetical protein A8L34_27725 [Bacillus sp. FJAT-27264]